MISNKKRRLRGKRRINRKAKKMVFISKMRDRKTLDDLRKVAEQVGDAKNKIMVEIGCYTGESTEIFCQEFKKVYAIDPWMDGKGYDPTDYASKSMGPHIEAAFDERMSKYDNLVKLKGFSYDLFKEFEDESLDFVYIDGDHTYEGVKKDILNFISKIRPNGFIGGHDYKPKWPGIMQAVDEQFGSPDYKYNDWSWVVKLNKDL